MSKKRNNKTTETAAVQPHYVQDLVAHGVAILTGRTEGELEEMLSRIPADIEYYRSPVSFYLDRGLYRVQINLKEN